VGAALALLFYFAVRGLSVGMVSRTAELNLFGIVSLAGLAGLFSRQASQKLHEIFETALNTRERRDDRGGDRSTSPSARLRRPVLSGIEPSAVPPGQATPLALQGEGFLRTSRVRVGNLELVPEFDSATRLRIALAAEQVAAVGSLPVLVINPDGGASEIQTLEVRA